MASVENNTPTSRIISSINQTRRGFRGIPSNDEDEDETPEPQMGDTDEPSILSLSPPSSSDIESAVTQSYQTGYQSRSDETTRFSPEPESELRRRRLLMTCLLPFSLILLLGDDEGNVGDDLWTVIFFLAMMNIVCAFLESSSREREREEARRERLSVSRIAVGGGAGAFRDDEANFTYMSFQAQLAAAILESRRVQVLEFLGRGDEVRPVEETPGVDEEHKKNWSKLTLFGGSMQKRKGDDDELELGNAGDVEDGRLQVDDPEDMVCSICLCEYESGEDAIRLPCGHVYHEECISSWTKNHTRCPLCNIDLVEENTENH